MRPIRNYYHSRFHEGLKTVVVHEQNSFSILNSFLLAEQFKLIIELGTFYCGVTALFHETDRNVEIHTFDRWDLMKNIKKAHLPITLEELAEFKSKVFNENVHFHIENILAEPKSLVELLKRPEKKFLYCDNGNKAKEIIMYSKYLNIGDSLGVHDWELEVGYARIKDSLQNFTGWEINKRLVKENCSTRLFWRV